MPEPIRFPVTPNKARIHTCEIFVTPAPDIPGGFRWGCACGDSNTSANAHELGDQIAAHTTVCNG